MMTGLLRPIGTRTDCKSALTMRSNIEIQALEAQVGRLRQQGKGFSISGTFYLPNQNGQHLFQGLYTILCTNDL